MSETATTTTTAAARGANKAARTIIDTVEKAGDHITPQVVETAELAMSLDVPTKVVLNQRVIVAVTAVASAAAGAGILWGVNKFRAHRNNVKLNEAVDEALTPNTTK